MRIDNKHSINEILNLVSQFIEKKIVNLDKTNREHPIVFHYYTEIVRYWSKLNYIFQKTLRSLDLHDMPQKDIATYIYTTYVHSTAGAVE